MSLEIEPSHKDWFHIYGRYQWIDGLFTPNELQYIFETETIDVSFKHEMNWEKFHHRYRIYAKKFIILRYTSKVSTKNF